MKGASLRQQALGGRAWREDDQAFDDASSYVADERQVELFHFPVSPHAGGTSRGGVNFRAETGAESIDTDSVFPHRNDRDARHRNVRDGQDRNLRSEQDQILPRAEGSKFAADAPPIDDIGTNEFTEICGDALYSAFGRLSAPIKRIAQVANVNERTAKNWWEKKCAPGPIHTLRLMAHVPEFQGEMRRLTAMERDIDPDFHRTLNDMVRLAQQHGFGGGR